MTAILTLTALSVYIILVLYDVLPSSPPSPALRPLSLWSYRVLTSFILTLHSSALLTPTNLGLFLVAQLLLIDIVPPTRRGLCDFSRCLLPTLTALVLLSPHAKNEIPFVFAVIGTAKAFRIIPSTLEQLLQVFIVSLPVLRIVDGRIEQIDEIKTVGLYAVVAIFVPAAMPDNLDWVVETMHHHVGAAKTIWRQRTDEVSWSKVVSVGGPVVSIAGVAIASMMEKDSVDAAYEQLWNYLSLTLLMGSGGAWIVSAFDSPSRSNSSNNNISSSISGVNNNNTSSATPTSLLWDDEMESPKGSIVRALGGSGATITPSFSSSSQNNINSNHSPHQNINNENMFLQRARHEDMMTFQAAMSFIHMLLVLFLTSIDMPYLAFVNLMIIAAMLFREHTAKSLCDLVSGVVVAQAFSLWMIRTQLLAHDAAMAAATAATTTNNAAFTPDTGRSGIYAIIEQVGLVYCSIRLVAGSILAEEFSRHAAETLLLASAALSCESGYSTRYLCLVMCWMAMFAARIRASAWIVASAWLNSEAEMRRFMDHELKVSFAGIMLALEHSLTDDGLEHLPEETVDILKEALAECRRGKELCFEAAVQRLAYDNAYELRIEGRLLGDGIQATYHTVENSLTAGDKVRVVYTDWNLVNHILDNAVANGSKYGTNLQMQSGLIQIGSKNPENNRRPGVLRVRVTNVPHKNERYAALLKMPDKSVLFEDLVVGRASHQMWTLGAGRNSTHLGLPVAKLFATRLGGKVGLTTDPDLTTFSLEVPVEIAQSSDVPGLVAVAAGGTAPVVAVTPTAVDGVQPAASAAAIKTTTASTTLSPPPPLSVTVDHPNNIPSPSSSAVLFGTGITSSTSSSVPSPTSLQSTSPTVRGSGGASGVGSGSGLADITGGALTFSSSLPNVLNSSSLNDAVEAEIPASYELPRGLVFAVLDDSSMIRSTMALTLKRDFFASDASFVTGATPSEALAFAKKAVTLRADICIVDENLDFETGGKSMVGTNIAKELRVLGYDGVIVLYSANEKLEYSLDRGLVDGFASKSTNRLDTKRLLTQIYFEWLRKKQQRAGLTSTSINSSGMPDRRHKSKLRAVDVGSSSALTMSQSSPKTASSGGSSVMTGGEDIAVTSLLVSRKSDSNNAVAAAGCDFRFVFVANEVKIPSQFDIFPVECHKPLSAFTAGKYRVAIIPMKLDAAKAIFAQDPYVAILGVCAPPLSAMSHPSFLYSQLVRFIAGLPAITLNPRIEDLILTVQSFDALCDYSGLGLMDTAILGDLSGLKKLSPVRFTNDVLLNQDMDVSGNRDFPTDEEDNSSESMTDVMLLTVVESLQRLFKRPTPDNTRKVAHLIKGASIQIGAMALHRSAARLEKCCDSDYDGTEVDRNNALIEFLQFMVDFHTQHGRKGNAAVVGRNRG